MTNIFVRAGLFLLIEPTAPRSHFASISLSDARFHPWSRRFEPVRVNPAKNRESYIPLAFLGMLVCICLSLAGCSGSPDQLQRFLALHKTETQGTDSTDTISGLGNSNLVLPNAFRNCRITERIALPATGEFRVPNRCSLRERGHNSWNEGMYCDRGPSRHCHNQLSLCAWHTRHLGGDRIQDKPCPRLRVTAPNWSKGN